MQEENILLQVAGESSECLYLNNVNRDLKPLGNGAYSISAEVYDDDVLYTITGTLTPNDHDGYDYILNATNGTDHASVTHVWGEISEVEFNALKSKALAEIEKAQASAPVQNPTQEQPGSNE